MPITPSVGVEVAPGYRLIERIGFGGYGEVWKVTAPGGLDKAVKIVYGDLTGPRAEQELKALERIKGVRHPFLLSLERFEVLDGQLLIFTELAECSLLDLFRRRREAGQAGIPRDELLGHLHDTADALDYMNETHGLQHLDIKPENVLLLGGRAKVADFGLVKDVAGTGTRITGGITPIYAAPEAFDARASRYSDQYSLAIVYQEMLTGVRPFPGTTAFQLAAQHTCAPPLLDPLPPQDREAVARALSKVPQQRFASCREFIERLRAPAPPAAAPLPVPDRLFSMDTLQPGAALQRLTGHQSRPRQATPAAEPAEPADTSVLTSDPGGLRPTLFVGVGGLAGLVLRRLKRRLARQFGDLERLGIFRMLLVDTDRSSLRHAQQGPAGQALTPAEVYHCPLYPPEFYRDQSQDLLRWIDRRWLFGVPRSLQTEGVRILGRLALVDNAAGLLGSLRESLKGLSSRDARIAAVGATARGLRSEAPRVFVVAGITGGTGSGMVADVGYAARQVLAELGLPDDGVCGVLLCASGPLPDEVTRARVNGYAALRELSHWARPDASYPGVPERSIRPQGPGQPPFSDAYLLYQLGDTTPGSQEALADRLAEYLRFDATFGGALDRLRQNSREGPGQFVWRSCGLSKLRFPREELTERVNQALCQKLIERWRGEVTPADGECLTAQTQELLAQHGLGEEALLGRCRDLLLFLLGKDPELTYRELTDPIRASDGPLTLGSPAALKALAPIDGLLGAGSEPDGVTERPSPLELQMPQEARGLGAEVARGVIGWLLELVETPGQRLKAADHALKALTEALQAESQKAHTQVRQLRGARQGLRQRLAGKEGSRVSGFLPTGLRKLWGDAAADRPVWGYFCLRMEELAQEGVVALLQAVQSGLSAWGLDLAQARRRLAELPALLSPAPAPSAPATSDPALAGVLPYGVGDVAAAVDHLLSHQPVDLARQFELVFQSEILDSGGGLWALLTGKLDVTRLSLSRSPESMAFWDLVCQEEKVGINLRAELMKSARSLVSEFLRGMDLPGLLVERYGDAELLQDLIRQRVDAAAPSLGDGATWQHLMVTVPESANAAVLRDCALEVLVGVPITVLEAGDALQIAWEVAHLPLAATLDALADGDPAIVELAGKLLTRRDVDWAPV